MKKQLQIIQDKCYNNEELSTEEAAIAASSFERFTVTAALVPKGGLNSPEIRERVFFETTDAAKAVAFAEKYIGRYLIDVVDVWYKEYGEQIDSPWQIIVPWRPKE